MVIEYQLYDASNKILGRFCSHIAKKTLLGEYIVIINAKDAIISGTKRDIHEKYLAKSVVALVEQKDFISQCILTSFDFETVKKVKRLNSEIKAGYIFSKMPKDEDVFTANVELLSVNRKLVDEEFVKKAHANNKEVHVWTVNDPEEMRRLIVLGVDNIITNYPNVLFEILNEK